MGTPWELHGNILGTDPKKQKKSPLPSPLPKRKTLSLPELLIAEKTPVT